MKPVPEGTGTWAPNDYTALRDRLIGLQCAAQDGGGLFPRGWTPEVEEQAPEGRKTRNE